MHLVPSLTHTSHRNFATARFLVISSPASYRDVQKELIAEFHVTANWPVVVIVDGNINKPNKTDYMDKDGSYIILRQDRNFKFVRPNLMG
jgi:archaellum component FlaG (FlaF/FlaG flagellin family)